MTPNEKGALACAKLDQRAIEKGAVVSVPILDARYDRVLDWDGRLWRVQVKYCDRGLPKSEGSVLVNLQPFGHNRRTLESYGAHEVDAIAVYLPRVDAVCWFEADVFEGRSTLTLRLAPPKNGQRKGIRLYTDHVW